eukprot:3059749-Rhodomonas_salina.3
MRRRRRVGWQQHSRSQYRTSPYKSADHRYRRVLNTTVSTGHRVAKPFERSQHYSQHRTSRRKAVGR